MVIHLHVHTQAFSNHNQNNKHLQIIGALKHSQSIIITEKNYTCILILLRKYKSTSQNNEVWLGKLTVLGMTQMDWLVHKTPTQPKNNRGHPRGRFGRKSLPKLADFSLSWVEGEVKMYRMYREIQNLDQNFSLKSWNCSKTSPSLKAVRWPLNKSKTRNYLHITTHINTVSHTHKKTKKVFFIHFMKFEWNLSILSSDLRSEGSQMMGPENAMLSLKISL